MNTKSLFAPSYKLILNTKQPCKQLLSSNTKHMCNCLSTWKHTRTKTVLTIESLFSSAAVVDGDKNFHFSTGSNYNGSKETFMKIEYQSNLVLSASLCVRFFWLTIKLMVTSKQYRNDTVVAKANKTIVNITTSLITNSDSVRFALLLVKVK